MKDRESLMRERRGKERKLTRMKRKIWKCLSMLGIVTITTTGLVACQEKPTAEAGLKIGMVTDAGTIDDKSFNQGTWEGIVQYANEHDEVKKSYVQPTDDTTQAFVEAIDNLILSGHNVIVTPGFAFEEAIGQVQSNYPEVRFILIDGQPLVGQDENEQPIYEIGENTVSLSFSEHEAGFLAGVASALESKQGKLAYLGGVPVPAVQKLGWGFVSGVAYANQMFGTEAQVVDYLYQGTFTETQAGKTIAGGMYDKGIDIIFAAAGAVGVGAINETKTRVESGAELYVVGVDVDQYEEGRLTDGRSVILTSAVKQLGHATYQMLDAIANDEFSGGEALVMDLTLNGVGLPTENPNLSEETLEKVQQTIEAIQQGQVVVPNSLETLEAYLQTCNYSVEGLTY